MEKLCQQVPTIRRVEKKQHWHDNTKNPLKSLEWQKHKESFEKSPMARRKGQTGVAPGVSRRA
jgi:hypothetical protein